MASHRSDEERASWVSRWRSSGAGCERFARRHGLAPSTLCQNNNRHPSFLLAEQSLFAEPGATKTWVSDFVFAEPGATKTWVSGFVSSTKTWVSGFVSSASSAVSPSRTSASRSSRPPVSLDTWPPLKSPSIFRRPTVRNATSIRYSLSSSPRLSWCVQVPGSTRLSTKTGDFKSPPVIDPG